jgi:hypothetical protein
VISKTKEPTADEQIGYHGDGNSGIELWDAVDRGEPGRKLLSESAEF